MQTNKPRIFLDLFFCNTVNFIICEIEIIGQKIVCAFEYYPWLGRIHVIGHFLDSFSTKNQTQTSYITKP